MEDLAPPALARRVSRLPAAVRPRAFAQLHNHFLLFLSTIWFLLPTVFCHACSFFALPQAAVRYVRSVSADHQIDPTRVAIMGDSAGAVTSLYVG